MTPHDVATAPAPAHRIDVDHLLAELPRIDADPVALGEARARLGERPVWHGGELTWVDVESGLVHRWPDADPARARRPWPAGSTVGIAWPAGSGGVLAAATGGLRLIDPDPARPGHSALLGATPPPGRRWNDGATDPAGRLWLTSMPADDATAPGAVHRIVPETAEVAITNVTCGNGIQFSPDGDWMYLTDSVRRVLYRLRYDLDTGIPGPPEPLLAFTADGPIPDGTTVDADGALWVAVWGAGAVLRLTPEGEPVDAMVLPVPLTTCLAIGPDGTGWVTTAGQPDARLGDPGIAEGAGAVWRVTLPAGVRPGRITPVRGA